MTLLALLFIVLLAVWLLYQGRAYLAWVLPVGLLFAWWWLRGSPPLWGFALALLPFAALALLFGLPNLRRTYVTKHVMKLMAPIFPAMSETERTALDAGTVWWDAELFSGKPAWKKLIDFKRPGLSQREQAFLDGPVEEICRMVDNEEVDARGDMTEECWQYVKDKGFMGIIIPEEYGGLGFSAEANSAIVTKVSSKSITLGVSVMVPNSLGPAELLLHYGTEEQKQHYLPRLADGREVPAFALTEPGAGSDASAMTSKGVVCKGQFEGEEVLGVRLNWNKRYITLAPVCTLLGLAFKLEDPEHLIGDEEHLGITCALVPVTLEGIETGRRHDPLGIKFLNGPTTGKDVFVPMSYLIGGAAMAGQGWRMLMDCLSAGRSLSLPGLAVGAAQLTARTVSGYAMIREQFGLPIGRFEGIEEPLARISGITWTMNAARTLTAGAVASGEKPSVISAIVKAYLTEGMRDVVNDGMDILGGAGISRGPRNILGRMYQAIPIGITVEGANILTRTLIIYGQGAIRCHPFAFIEMEAARAGDLEAFDRGFFGHMGFIASNATRSLVLGLSGGRLASAPVSGPAAIWFQRTSRLCAAFAIASDAAMALLGGSLKRKERLTGRLADCVAWLYLASACLKQFVDNGSRESDEPFLTWACENACYEVQEALDGFLRNLPNRPAAFFLRALIFPVGRPFSGPSDRQGQRIARAILEDGELRERLTGDIFLPDDLDIGLAAIDRGRELMLAAAEPRSKLKAAMRAGKLPRGAERDALDAALEAGVLSAAECEAVGDALAAQEHLVQVDAFDPEAYLARCGA